MTLLTQNKLARRWAINNTPVSDRTIRRIVARFGLRAAKFTGVQPLYSLAAVRRMERRRNAELLRQRKLTSAKISSAQLGNRKARAK